MFYLANKLALELWYVSFCASRLGEIRGRGEFLCFEIVSDQLALALAYQGLSFLR